MHAGRHGVEDGSDVMPPQALPFADGPSDDLGVHRKVVTVLFCDVVGSTALGESVDPEALQGLLARYFERMKAIVESHEGSVEKFIGDAVMAAFGVPAAHEDDALRACRAAVEMRAAFPALGVQGRIGLNTGEVVTGTGERLATGDAVNVAARLQQAAEPGQIILGEATWRLAREAVRVEAVGAVELKGRTEPVSAYSLLRVLGEPARRLDVPLVGRERELAVLREAWERSCSERRCVLATIVGDPGVGKSRLAEELLSAVEARVVRGRCLSYGEGISYWPVVEVVKQLGGIQVEDGAREPIRALLGDDVPTSSEEIAWAFRKLLESAAIERPLVVVFDDIHWGEEIFLDLVEHVALLSKGAPILLLCMTRAELLDRRPTWPVVLRLEPLGEADAIDLIGHGGQVRDQETCRRILRAAGGNPLFVREMVAMLGEGGEVAVPPTLQALLAARLDQLDGAERRVLERGAVEGEIFHRGAVMALAPEEQQVTARIASLVRRALVDPTEAQLLDEDGFRFCHLLIRDAAYDALAKASRADLHERFANWLEARAGDLVEAEEILGYHLEQAVRYRLELEPEDEAAHELAGRAAHFLVDAGQRARSRGDIPATASLLGRAAALLPGRDPDRLQILPDVADALTDLGEFEPARRLLRETIAEAEDSGDRLRLIEARILRLRLLIHHDPEGRTEESRAEVERALPELEQIGDDRALARAWSLLGWTHLMTGQFGLLATAMQRATEYARRAGDHREETKALGWVIAGVDHGPTPVPEAIEICERTIAEAANSPAVRTWSLYHLAYLYARAQRFDEARHACAQGRALNEDYEGKVSAAGWAMFDGYIERLAGSPTEAVEILREGIRVLEETGERSYLSTEVAVLAHNLLEAGMDEDAEQLTHRSEDLAAQDDLTSQVIWRFVRGACFARRGLIGEGEALVREAVALSEQSDSLDLRGDALVILGEVLGFAGREREARAALEAANGIYDRKGYHPDVNPARRRLAGRPHTKQRR
jgi:class 3 adenylate cyclase/tetratricopeptide (TPR) repeat protein